MAIKKIWEDLAWEKKEIENYDEIKDFALIKVFGDSDRGIEEAQKYFAKESGVDKTAFFYPGKPSLLVCETGNTEQTDSEDSNPIAVDVAEVAEFVEPAQPIQTESIDAEY